MTIDEMKAKKRELGLSSEMISRMAGVPLSTVQKIFGGVTKAPRMLTLMAIEDALWQEENRRRPKRYDFGKEPAIDASLVRESALYAAELSKEDSEKIAEQTGEKIAKGTSEESRKEKRYTISDYYALPEGRRAELIDGVFYDMTAPSWTHQQLLGDLHLLFRECADRHGMPCEVLMAPVDVRLDQDDDTMVQPDLVVICGGKEKIHPVHLEGAPDLVVEVLSPPTRSKDQILKLYKYLDAGVREYWIVDPKFRKVTVHCFEEDGENYCPVQYDFEETIPVGISGRTCEIDFSRVGKRPFR